jgi:carboxypeptidase Q
VTPVSLRSPHTGSLVYDSTAAPIPAAALTIEDAQMLHRMQDRGEKIVVRLDMAARMLSDAQSYNVVGDLKGTRQPDQVVLVSGHLDSWDVGQGAMDDGGGMVAAWEAVRLLKRLGLRPKRTIRVVGWTNEENGARGGQAYRNDHEAERHILAIESDAGTFRPRGVDFMGTDSALAIIREIAPLLDPIQSAGVTAGGGETDISFLVADGVPGLGLDVEDSRYFWYHHTQGDTLDKLDPADLARCVATLALMAYVVADLENPLPRGGPQPE